MFIVYSLGSNTSLLFEHFRFTYSSLDKGVLLYLLINREFFRITDC